MKCPKCGEPTHVSQVRSETSRRRRQCLSMPCRYTFHTVEVEVPAFEHGGDRRSADYSAKPYRKTATA